MAYWGTQTYSAGDRVPLRRERCVSVEGPGNAHVCRQHHSHVGPHRCICGRSWAEAVGA